MAIVFKEVLKLEKAIKELTTAELINLIRKYHQIDLYTVKEYWCLQLFDLDDCPNDIGISCVWENDNKSLNELLMDAVEYIAECIYDN